MTSQTFNTSDELRRVIAEGRISEDALQAITSIHPDKLRAFLDEPLPGATGLTRTPQELSGDERARLSVLASQITQGLEINDDERLQAILEGLTAQFRLTVVNIALLADVELEDVETALRDPGSLSAETKYRLALKTLYVGNAINQALSR